MRSRSSTRRARVWLVASAVAVMGVGSTAAAVASSPSTDAQGLATAEAHVVTLLHGFKNTATWKAEYKAAVATQTADLNKLNTDLFPTVKPAPTTIAGPILTWSGSGIENSQPFRTHGPVNISYTYNCASFGESGDFSITVEDTSGNPIDIPVNTSGNSGGATSYEPVSAGSYILSVDSECDWTIRVNSA